MNQGLITSMQGMMAHSQAAQTVGKNISKANIDGYHRRDTLITSGGFGFGVRVTEQRAGEVFLEKQVRLQSEEVAYLDVRSGQLRRLESVISALGENGLDDTLTEFFSAWREASVNPTSIPLRNEILQTLSRLTFQVNEKATLLNQARVDISESIDGTINRINDVASQIAALNERIGFLDASGISSLDIQDERDRMLVELSGLVGGNYFLDKDQMSVFIGDGLQLVGGVHAHKLSQQIDPITGESYIQLAGVIAPDIKSSLNSGELGGLLAVREEDLEGWITNLDNWVNDLTTAFNTLHATYYGLDAVNARNLLTTADPAAPALTLAVSPDVLDLPNNLAMAATDTSGLGDNAGAIAMVQLQEVNNANGNTSTLSNALRSLVENSASLIQGVDTRLEVAKSRLVATEQLLEERIGVSIEEQLLSLSYYQSAFQAGSRVIATINQMLETFLKM